MQTSRAAAFAASTALPPPKPMTTSQSEALRAFAASVMVTSVGLGLPLVMGSQAKPMESIAASISPQMGRDATPGSVTIMALLTPSTLRASAKPSARSLLNIVRTVEK